MSQITIGSTNTDFTEVLDSIPNESVLKLLGLHSDMQRTISYAIEQALHTKRVEATGIPVKHSPSVEATLYNLQQAVATYLRANKLEHIAGGLSEDTFAKECESVFKQAGIDLPKTENGRPKNLITDVAKQVAKEILSGVEKVAKIHAQAAATALTAQATR